MSGLWSDLAETDSFLREHLAVFYAPKFTWPESIKATALKHLVHKKG